MEMDSNPITKPSKKGTILSAVFYALAAVLLITAFVSLAACHQNISLQLEQGVPVPVSYTHLDVYKRQAELNGADFTEPITAGIFVSIAAWASYQRSEDETPYWRTLKANGELNAKYPGGIEAQKEKLEAEGHTIIQKLSLIHI